MVDPLTLSVATCAMVGFNIVLMVTINASKWYHSVARWWTKDDYNIVKVYKASDSEHFDLFTIFLNFFLCETGNIPGLDKSVHLASYQINKRVYFTLLGQSFMKITTNISPARQKQLRLKNPTIEFWLYGIGEGGQLPHGYEYWVKPKYNDDVNQMLLIFAKLSGYNMIDTGVLFSISSQTMRKSTYQKIIDLNRAELCACLRETARTAQNIPLITDNRATIQVKVSELHHNPSATFALALAQPIERFTCPNKLSNHLRDVVAKKYPPAVSRVFAAPIIIQNLPVFMMMKARELSLDVKMEAGKSVGRMIRRNKSTIDNFFKDVIAQHQGYPCVKQYLEIFYYLLLSSTLKGSSLKKVFESLPTADYSELIEDGLPSRDTAGEVVVTATTAAKITGE